METVLLTEDEYTRALMETFTAPNDQIEVSVTIPPHPITNDEDLNNAICRYRTVRYKRVGEPGSIEWQPLTMIYKVTPIAP